jgi:hypothetical protein
VSRQGPALSFVVGTDAMATVEDTLAHLRAQDVRDRIEVVVAAPRSSNVDPASPAFEGFWGARHVPVDSVESLSHARAAGIRAARAPVVVLGETHAFPERGWASALLAAHDEPCAAVAPCVANANPSTTMSWANFFLDYGPWSELPQRTELADLPGHNSSYKRDLLLELGDRLEPLLEAETFLHQELRSRGHRLLIEPAARLRHVNVSRWRWFLFERFSVGQRFGGARAQGFPRWRRAVYAAGSPLIPAVRMPRVLRDVRRSGRRAELLPAILPTLLLGLVLSALGELAGYLAGPGASAERLSRIELYKQRYVRPEERQPPASRG